jgi:tetratricopeptide (TPR) repeat protein
MKKRMVFLLTWCVSGSLLYAQSTAVFTEADLSYKQGMEFYQLGLLGKARSAFTATIELLRPVNEPDARLLRTRAELYLAKSALLLQLPEGEKLILEFIKKYQPDPIASEALSDAAKYYYDARNYEKSIEFYKQMEWNSLSKSQRDEGRFRLGYSYFVTKKFPEAKSEFREIKDVRNVFYEPTNYYLGLCYFFEGNYRESISYLKIAERNERFKEQIPYYICQIYFAERQYDELIAYAKPLANNEKTSRLGEIRQLLGQAYFEKGDYSNALPHLEYYASRNDRLREEEFYQLGYAQYITGNYPAATRSFGELAAVNSRLGQYAMYYQGDAWIRQKQLQKARSSFAVARRMSFDPAVQEDALFQYGKLSYELKDPREALAALQGIRPDSKNYQQAQSLMSEIFLSSRDYRQAIEILEKMPDKTPALRETYQKVTFLRGMQLLRENDASAAKAHFERSLRDAPNAAYKALATYWLGDLAYREKDYNNSIRLLNQFITLARTMRDLPDESSIFTANYLQGYNYLKKKDYQTALGFFRDALDGIRRNRSFINNTTVKDQILGDATLRAADCFFERRQYVDAVRLYDEAVNSRYEGFEYALFQKAIIEGLRGRKTEKILALDRLVRDFPNSEYADDALYNIGITYQNMLQPNRAVAPLRQLVTSYKGKSDLVNKGFLSLGQISYNQGVVDEAIDYYKQVFSNNPTPDDAKFAREALEQIYTEKGDPDGYIAFIKNVAGYKIDEPVKDSITYRAAKIQFESGNYARATEVLSDYLRKFPQGIYALDARYQRAESYAALGDFNNAIKDYEAVIEKGASRHYVKALEKAALIAEGQLGDYRKSYEFFARLENSTDNPDKRLIAQLGAIKGAYFLKNAQEVFTFANKVVTNPGASRSQVATAHYYNGKMSFDRKEYTPALVSLNEVGKLTDDIQAAEAGYLIAEIYFLQKDFTKAEQKCKSINAEGSDHYYWLAKSVILLADIYAETSRLIEARETLDILLERYDEDEELVQLARRKLEAVKRKINDSSRLNLNRSSNRLEMDNGGN